MAHPTASAAKARIERYRHRQDWHPAALQILINYAIGLLVLLLVIWFGFERKRFQGPPIGDMIARRQAEIRAAELAVGEAAH